MPGAARPVRAAAGAVGVTIAALLSLPLGSGAWLPAAHAEPPSNWTRREQEVYENVPGSSQDRGLLDATNPLDLMNRLRRATAMDDATDPDDAIDAALRDFEAQRTPGSAVGAP
jgi:hypothetical protein